MYGIPIPKTQPATWTSFNLHQRKRLEQPVAERVVGAARRRALVRPLLEHAGPGRADGRCTVVGAERVLQACRLTRTSTTFSPGRIASVTSTSQGCETRCPHSWPLTITLATLPYQLRYDDLVLAGNLLDFERLPVSHAGRVEWHPLLVPAHGRFTQSAAVDQVDRHGGRSPPGCDQFAGDRVDLDVLDRIWLPILSLAA